MSDLSGSVRNLLAAIADVLDVPDPALDRADESAHRFLVDERIQLVRGIVGDVLAGKAINGLGWEADYLRRRATARPVTYRTLDQAVDEAQVSTASALVAEPVPRSACEACGSTRGPLAPDPSGARYTSGEPVLACATGCAAGADGPEAGE
ncbi:hypothetical protein HHL19_36255 [Streptomyces sp. R302]|uniref:hypothetical protein n=1 Tax=unclassified Streptomyces TaxID=2593676 RepID=UPI00145D49D1|nr:MULTISPECIES: hypothetical protein [unclassified Streptomyces]NML55694.1 hypothetical protein [Streptomyces sp. R301]NML83964.1 hypothetical protein [Streptomyces sp. R302]